MSYAGEHPDDYVHDNTKHASEIRKEISRLSKELGYPTDEYITNPSDYKARLLKDRDYMNAKDIFDSLNI